MPAPGPLYDCVRCPQIPEHLTRRRTATCPLLPVDPSKANLRYRSQADLCRSSHCPRSHRGVENSLLEMGQDHRVMLADRSNERDRTAAGSDASRGCRATRSASSGLGSQNAGEHADDRRFVGWRSALTKAMSGRRSSADTSASFRSWLMSRASPCKACPAVHWEGRSTTPLSRMSARLPGRATCPQEERPYRRSPYLRQSVPA